MSDQPSTPRPSGPLGGVTVIELGSFIAGPFAGQLLADLGADVVKVEPPGAGDPMRTWGVTANGQSLWWPSLARNKRSVAIDLRRPEGRRLLEPLCREADVLLENFKPGVLAGWGYSDERLRELNPRLIVTHVSGYGQTGPYAARPGFGSIGEAMGGIRHTTGSPDRPPSRVGVSLGDCLGSLFAVIGTLAALHERDGSREGQSVDVALYEAVAAIMESSMADAHVAGVVRQRSGSVLPGVAPSNVYPTAGGEEVLIAANADPIFRRLAAAMGRPELADDPRFRAHEARGKHAEELDALIAEWTATLTKDELLATLDRHEVPCGLIYTALDMLSDPHYQARGMVQWLEEHDPPLPVTGVVPKLSRTPGSIRTMGPRLGEHTREVLTGMAGLDDDEVAALLADGVIE